jgi:GNAT superfamily N-acetyltransferase
MPDYMTVDENLRAAMRFFGYATGSGEIVSLPGSVAMFSGLDYGVFNIALLEGAVSGGGSALQSRLNEIARYFRPRTPRWSLWLCEDLLDAPLRRRSRQILNDFGMREISHPPGMIAPEIQPPAHPLPEIALHSVGPDSMYRVFTEITSVCFEIPFAIAHAVYSQEKAWQGPYRGFVGVHGGEPVSIVAIVASADALGVYSLATHPSYRQRGFGEATMRAALEQVSRETGIRRVVLQSTEAGYPLYRRMGFRDVTRYSVYLTK